MAKGLEQQKLAVQTGYWPLYRYNPDLLDEGSNPLVIDSKEPALPLERYVYNETRYRMLAQSNPERAEVLLHEAEQDVRKQWRHYRQLQRMFQPESMGEEK